MKLHVIKTGSKGNCYIIEHENKYLILEAGATIKEIQDYFHKSKIKFSLFNVVGCLITHEHGDHAKYAKDYYKSGIKLFTSSGTNKYLHNNFNFSGQVIFHQIPFSVDEFFCIGITSYHDAAEPLNFIIRISDRTIVYITDTGHVPFDFDFVVDLLICEVNYCQDLINDNMATGKLNTALYSRIVRDHLSKEQVFELLENNKGKVKQLVSVHMSSSNIELKGLASDFIKEFGIITTIAEKHKQIYF